MVSTVTDVVNRTLLLAFDDISFTALDTEYFCAFLHETTQGSEVEFELTGLADSKSSFVFVTAEICLIAPVLPFSAFINCDRTIIPFLDQVRRPDVYFRSSRIKRATGDCQ